MSWLPGVWSGLGSSGLTGYTRTRAELCEMVLRKVRVLGVDRTPGPEEEAIVLEAIDLRLKELHRLGTLPWKVSGTLTDVELTADVATATAPTNMLSPIAMALRVNDDDSPIDIISPRQYQEIVTKTQRGRPDRVLVYGSTFRFYPVPDQDYTVKLIYQRVISDTDEDNALDIVAPVIRWLKDLVAYDVGDDFRVPDQRMMRFAAEAKVAERNIRSLLPMRTDHLPVEAEYF